MSYVFETINFVIRYFRKRSIHSKLLKFKPKVITLYYEKILVGHISRLVTKKLRQIVGLLIET